MRQGTQSFVFIVILLRRHCNIMETNRKLLNAAENFKVVLKRRKFN